MKKMLIAYYSWTNGNTEGIAQQLQRATGADIVRIDTVTPYPTDYNTTVDQGKREVEAGVHPAIKPLDVNIEDYDVIVIGTPTWWYTMAPTVATFCSQNNWAGKTVVPFMTNGGWPGTVIDDIAAACDGAEVACPFEVQFDSTGGAELVTDPYEIQAWVEDVKALLN